MAKKAFAAAAIVYFFLAAAAAAEDIGRFDVSVAWGGAFGHTSSSSPFGRVSIVSTNSPLLLATLRFRPNRMHGVALNYGSTRDSQIFMLSPDNFRVETKVTEYSVNYVFSPFHFEKLDPFVFAGAGALRFDPGNTSIDGFQSAFGAARQTSFAFLYGGGVDYVVWKRLALRAQYRGLLYKEPNFHLQQFVTNVRGHAPAASIGIVFRF
ncbi:MAG: outer membrane beta-barrel protein [Acidobacteria bacterium]|nr:outer membrane beta-barrel protein [Acidobacteriota bacterium]